MPSGLYRTMLEITFLILSITVYVKGYSAGPLDNVCGTMMPGHGPQGQTTPVPYTISFGNDATTYSPNEEIQVTLQGSPTFKGFFIQPRTSASNDTNYGSLTIPTNGRAACSNGVAVCHKDNYLKTSVTMTWTAPSADVYSGPIVFVYTVVQSASVFWVKQVSATLNYKTAVVPQTQPSTTQTVRITTTQAQPLTNQTARITTTQAQPLTTQTARITTTQTQPSTTQTARITTTQAQSSNGPTAVTKDSKCGSELGCFHDCEGESNCNFLFTWKVGGGDEVECTMTCKQNANKYCSIGWSKDDKMGDDYVFAIGPNSGQIEVKNFYNVKPSTKFCEPLDEPYLGLRLISQSYNNGVMHVKFARTKTFALAQSSSGRKKRAASDASTFFDMNEAWNLFYAEGPYIAGSVSQHSAPPLVSSRKADFQKAEDLGAEASKVDLVYLHATFMVAAWMFFATFGIFTARYYKLVWPEDAKLCGEKRWFNMHRFCMVMAFLLCAAGFVVIFVHVEGYSEIVGNGFEKSHPIIGIVVMGLALLNPTIAIFRPHPGTKYRPVFNFFHSLFGQGAHSLSIVNIFSGTVLSATNVPSYIRIILYVFVGWIVVTEVAFIIMTYCFRKNDRSAAYEMTAKGSHGDSETHRQSISNGKTLFLGLHAVILLGFAAATAVIVWVERDQ